MQRKRKENVRDGKKIKEIKKETSEVEPRCNLVRCTKRVRDQRRYFVKSEIDDGTCEGRHIA
jgi:hypothetical protein